MPASTAIDIGSYSIKVITGKPGKNPFVDKVIEVPNNLDISYPHDDNQAEKLLNFLADIFHDNRLPKTDVRLSLPEDAVSTQVIELPPLSDAELASAIDWQAEQHIPIPLEKLSLEYQILHRPPKKVKDEPMRVLLVGAKKDLVDRYTNVFLNLGIQPKILETQMFSIIRALGFEKQDPTTLIAHVGHSSTQMSVVSQAEFKLVINHQSGGSLLTKTLKQSIENINQEQAAEYKHSYGLMKDQLQGKIRDALIPAVESFAKEIQKTLRYYNSQYPQDKISRIVISGGTAQLRGLVEYLTKLTNNEVLMASPFGVAKGNIPEQNQQAMIVCMGLLMRKD
jgi:type IV pilus assembly protein PilM